MLKRLLKFKPKKEKVQLPAKVNGYILFPRAWMPVGLAIITVIDLSTTGGSLMTLFYGIGALGATANFVNLVERYSVAKKIAGQPNRFTEFVYRVFEKTPLRHITLNMANKWVESRMLRQNENLVTQSAVVSNTPDSQKTNTPKAEEDIKVARTVRYIADVSDPRKRFIHVTIIALGAFTALRVITDPMLFKQSLARNIIKVGGYLTGVTASSAQIAAFVKQKSVEPEAKPFYILGDRYLNFFPLKQLSRALVKYDYAKISDLQAGRQPFERRIAGAVISRIPMRALRTRLSKYIGLDQLEITPRVMELLAEKGIDKRVDALRCAAEGTQDTTKPAPQLSVIIKDAYKALLKDNAPLTEELTGNYQKYVLQVEARNADYPQRLDAHQVEKRKLVQFMWRKSARIARRTVPTSILARRNALHFC